MKISICKTLMEFPAEIGELRDSNDILNNTKALHSRIQEDGYLFLRSFHDRNDVLQAKEKLEYELANASRNEEKLNMDKLAHTKTFSKIFESKKLFEFFDIFFGERAITFDNKWLRSVPPKGYTGLHFDNVYMGRGSKRVHTVWNPIGDINPDLGTIIINVGDDRKLKQNLIETYGMIDVDKDKISGAGWYTNNPYEYIEKYGGQFKTASFKAGDIVIFPMFTMHSGTRNLTDRNRYSCDIRFQPASDLVDDRWYGKNRTGHTYYGRNDKTTKTIEDIKKELDI